VTGYAGHILRVDLTSGKTSVEPLDPIMVEQFLGGRGFGAYLLYAETEPGLAPLSPQNPLILSAGPLSGLLVPGAGKLDITTKSPLTGGYASANIGGLLAAELKYAGYDCVVITGQADNPVMICIEDDQVQIRDAGAYWGLGSLTVEEQLKEELGEEFQIATIGPAGENLVSYACITHDFGRQAGRGGVGTVMGAKKLKAIAVRGTRAIPVADLDAYREQARAMFDACRSAEGLEVWQRYGTSGVNTWSNEIGAFPTRNFQSGTIEGYENLSGEVMREKIVVSDKACFACPSPCGKYSYVRKHGVRVEGPEYETAALLGGDCGLTDIQDVAYANWLADELGLDSISAGNCIAFAMECYQRGVIGPAHTDGLELQFGAPETVFTLLKRIAHREGIGDVLAKGVKRTAAEWGGGSEAWAIHVKGMEQSGYETHHAPSMLLAYMTCDVGAHHNRAWAITYDLQVGRDGYTPDKAAKVIELQHIRPLFDCLGCCRLQWVELGLDLAYYAPMLRAVTGLNTTWEDLLAISERVWNLTRLYWMREVTGFGRGWDAPPARFHEEPAVGGATAGRKADWDSTQALLDEYYRQRGWDQQGLPTAETLVRLGLDRL
jgi:aldehyde:ferredoxin oxidoreductase